MINHPLRWLAAGNPSYTVAYCLAPNPGQPRARRHSPSAITDHDSPLLLTFVPVELQVETDIIIQSKGPRYG